MAIQDQARHASARTVVFLPDWRAANPYQSLLAAALSRQGVEVRFHKMPRGVLALNRLPAAVRQSDVVHLHWVNDLIEHVNWTGLGAVRWLKRLLLGIDVWLLRARGVRVVWTVHNLVAHESDDEQAEVLARRTLALSCSQLIVHSRSALSRIERRYGARLARRALVIPHGNYDGCYPADDDALAMLRQRLALSGDEVVVLFFGAVRRYKGIIEFLDLFKRVRNPRLRLLVAGNPNPPVLAEEIQRVAASDRRISLHLDFIPDDQVHAHYSLADLVVIPFERTLTSGSATLAMTMGKAMLLPEAARVFDLVDDGSGYFYRSDAELQTYLENLDRDDLRTRGQVARRQAEALAWDAIGEATLDAYAERSRRCHSKDDGR